MKKPFVPVLLAFLFVCGLMAGRSSADELEKGLQQDLLESKMKVDQAGAKLRSGEAPTAEIARLKSVAEKVRASHLLMEERFRQQSEKASALGGKAVERQNAVADAYGKAIDVYLALIDALPPDGSVIQATLDALTTLLDRIIPQKKRPLLGTLPYQHLNYPAREPATSPIIVPAYKGGNRDVNPAGSAASAEAPISVEITTLAQSLQWSPVLIYEWVKNNVSTEWYWGAMKGAEETLHQKSGNDADQSALLVSLLRASGFPARFVKGSIEFFPGIDRVKNLTGIDDPLKIAAFFQKAGIPFKPVIAGGGIANFQVEHIWVETFIPYSNYRGAVLDDQGKSWFGLDTSIKTLDYQRSAPIAVGFPLDTLRDDYLQALQPLTPLEYLKGKAEEQLAQNHPDKSWQDLLATATFPPHILKIIPSSLQFKTIAITGEYAELPAELRHQVKFTATSEGSGLSSLTLDAMRLSNRKVVLTYEPETVEDQQIIDSYGGLDNTPSYLVRLRPVLTVDGERQVVAQDGLPMGTDYTLTIDIFTPGGAETVTSTQITGNLSIIGIVAQKAAAVTPIADGDDAETILFKEATGYIDRWNKAEDELAAFYRVALSRPAPTIVTVGGQIDVTWLLGIPHDFTWKGVFIDAGYRRVETVGRSSDAETGFMRLSALQGSILENRIFEDDFQVDSVSTAKLLQLAKTNNTPILSIDKSNIDATIQTLPFDAAVKEDITNAVGQGLTVTIPQMEVAYQDWSGIGYLKENRETGESGWMLSGQVAGGMTAVSKDKWLNQNPVAVLSQPYTVNPNVNPAEVDSLKRGTDYIQGKAGEKLANPLMVMAVDKEGRPVQGVPVNFRIIAGGGELAGKDITTKLLVTGDSVTVATGRNGIAQAQFTLGKYTADSPLYAYGDPNSILVGQNIVAVSAPKGNRDIFTDKPIEAYGYPGDAVDLVKVAPSRTDNLTGYVNTYSGPVWVKAVDQNGNAVSNKKVTFDTGTPVSLWTPPLGTNLTAQLFENQQDCPGIPTRQSCAAGKLFDTIEKYTDTNGVFVSVILGDTDNTGYPISAKMKKDKDGKETRDEVTTTFNHNTYAIINTNSGSPANSLMSAVSVYQVDATGTRIDVGRAGKPMKEALLTVLLYHSIPANAASRTFTTTQVTDGKVDYSTIAGGGTVFPSTAIASPGSASYKTYLTLGDNPGLNKILAVGSATVNGQLLQSVTTFSVTGVKPEVVPDQTVFINKDGYSETDVQLTYSVSPADYHTSSTYLYFYEITETPGSVPGSTIQKKDYMGLIPGGATSALMSQGGAKFDIRKKYTVQLVLNLGSGIEVRSDEVPLDVTMLCLIPDYNHNRNIDRDDRKRALKKDTYYFWINDNNDEGDTGGDGIPGTNKNQFTPKISGTRDVVDWFPVQLDLTDLMDKFDPSQYLYALKHTAERLRFIYTDLTPEKSGDYLTDVPTAQKLVETAMINDITSLNGITSRTSLQLNRLDAAFLQKVKTDGKGIILLEGVDKAAEPLVLEIYDSANKKVFTSSLKISLDGIEQMFRHKNLSQAGDGPAPFPTEQDRLTNPSNYPDSETNGKNFVFVHGYNVNAQQARGWNAEMFKRMYWSGSRAKFWGVTWYGWDSQIAVDDFHVTRNFHINVQHALKTVPAFSDFINWTVSGSGGYVTVAAHSLGNMLVSSAIAEKGATINNYFLIDSAVPIEAYDGTVGMPLKLTDTIDSSANQMVVWNGYNAKLLASEWYRLFPSYDERNKLTWRGRFASVKDKSKAYNFYSSGEDVLDNHTGAPTVPDIITKGVGRFAWGLQEKLKGMLPTGWMLGSSYGGWGINVDAYNEWIVDAAGHTVQIAMTPETANTQLTTDKIIEKPFFKLAGDDLTLLQPYPVGSDYAKNNHDRLLAEAIPALSLAAGKNEVPVFDDVTPKMIRNFDMNLRYKKEWPYDRVFVKKSVDWWHSDIREVSYPYVKDLFLKLTELGK